MSPCVTCDATCCLMCCLTTQHCFFSALQQCWRILLYLTGQKSVCRRLQKYRLASSTLFSLTCLQSEASRLRLLVEMVRLIVMPANCRLLFPRMEVRHRWVGCTGQQERFKKKERETEPNREENTQPKILLFLSVSSCILTLQGTTNRPLPAGVGGACMCRKVGEQLQLWKRSPSPGPTTATETAELAKCTTENKASAALLCLFSPLSPTSSPQAPGKGCQGNNVGCKGGACAQPRETSDRPDQADPTASLYSGWSPKSVLSGEPRCQTFHGQETQLTIAGPLLYDACWAISSLVPSVWACETGGGLLINGC